MSCSECQHCKAESAFSHVNDLESGSIVGVSGHFVFQLLFMKPPQSVFGDGTRYENYWTISVGGSDYGFNFPLTKEDFVKYLSENFDPNDVHVYREGW